MNRWTVLLVAIAFATLVTMGCSSGGTNPVVPTDGTDLSLSSQGSTQNANTCLWGYFDVFIDIENQTVEAVHDRTVMFTANVVTFINMNPANLKFLVKEILPGPDYLDVDIDVTLNHPFPGLNQFDGYDVRGVFMGDGSASLNYNGSLVYPVQGTDQFQLADPDFPGGEHGQPDGYTRWFNLTEFANPSMDMFGYTQGMFASIGFDGTATLCPYKYFSDGLGTTEELWTWLNDHAGQNGQFSSGASNTRNYYLRFPNTKGVEFGYAVIANWEGVEPEHHPSNTPEAVGCKVVDNSNVYYVDPTNNGGNLVLDISLFGWEYQPSKIFIESTVLGSPHEFTAGEMTPVGGTENYSTYHTEIPADNVTGTEGQEFWVIAQYDDFDYSNEFGVSNLAGTDKLAAFFRYDLSVSGDIPAWIEVILPNGGEVWKIGSDEEITWTSENVSGTLFIDYSKDNFVSDIHSIAVDEPNDAGFMWEGIPNDPSTTVRVRVSSTDDPGVFDISDADFSIAGSGWARTWGGIGADYSHDIASDGSGNVYVTGRFNWTVDFDPGSGVDNHTSNGGDDIYLSKFDSSGSFLWAKTWGGSGPVDVGDGIAIDGSGNVYVCGRFSSTVDFDPGSGVENHTSNGGYDVYLSKFDSSGDHQWAKTWGASYTDIGYGVAVDGSNVYVIGAFFYTVDFDPGSGVENHTSNGSYDVYLSKFDSSGSFLWAKTWGGSSSDFGYTVAPDGSGNLYLTGIFGGTVDFDPGSGVDIHASNGGYDVFLSKFDSSGSFLWAKTWGGGSVDRGYFVASDGSGNVYVTGYFSFTVDFDPGSGVDNHTSNGSYDVFLSKIDSSGSFLWAKTWGGSGIDIGYSVAPDGSDVYVTGHFNGTVDFDPGSGVDNHTSNGADDVFLGKFDSSGDNQWARTWGGSGSDSGYGVAADGSGNVYVTGYFNGTVDFDPGSGVDNHTSNGGNDVFLSKFFSDGSW